MNPRHAFLSPRGQGSAKDAKMERKLLFLDQFKFDPTTKALRHGGQNRNTGLSNEAIFSVSLCLRGESV